MEEVAACLKHLFAMVQVNNTSLMVRTFLKAFNSDIALCVEREGLPKTFDAVVTRAATMDRMNRRFGIDGDTNSVSNQFYSAPSINNAASTQETIDELVKQVQELSTVVARLPVQIPLLTFGKL